MDNDPSTRGRRLLWRSFAFLTGFALMLVAALRYFLLPALRAAAAAPPPERHRLAAISAALMAVILLCLFLGWLLVFRINRLFFPGSPETPKSSTPYVDAWSEAGHRLPTPPPPTVEPDDPHDN